MANSASLKKTCSEERAGSSPVSPTCRCGGDAWASGKCRTCYHRDYYYVLRQRLYEYVDPDPKCARCGRRESLQFDHIDPAQKSFDIQENLTLNARVRAELDKCQLLCDSCHRRKSGDAMKGWSHGTMYGWMKKRCQCAECCRAKREWNDRRNAARRSA